MNKIKSVVIDDEFFNRELITMLIEKLNPNFIISGEAESVAEGYKLINEIKPDVVFMDIKMPDGSGFDLLKQFSSVNFEVVFISGFDNYALEAFEHSALDYVLKPIDLDKFKQTLDRVQQRLERNIPDLKMLKDSVQSSSDIPTVVKKIPIHYNNKVILLSVNEIQYILSKDGCTWFFKEQDEKYSSSKQLSDFEFILNSLPNFIQINKSTYINLNFIVSYSKGMECFITMKNNSMLEISRRKKAEILELLDQKKGN